MRIVQINSVCRGSTGTIMLSIAEAVRGNSGEAYTFSERRRQNGILEDHRFFGNRVENLFHRGFSVITGISGIGSSVGTRNLLRELDSLSPNILHLHNLHGWYINVPMLFDYIRQRKIKTVWTLHDCWGFTAQCSHFTIEKCEKWKTGCYDCPRYRLYPYTWVDRTRKMYTLKKEWLTGLEGLTIVTPSVWLANLVRQSFLKDYPVRVIHNGIDVSVFKPTLSNFKEEYNLEDKKMILGVASGWSYRKGFDVFLDLYKRLDSNRYQIVLVGTDDHVDEQLPPNIISIHRTQNQQELAEIYSASDVFVNPTREENYPTVNMEAIACGTPVVTFRTGGSPEILDDTCGSVVDCDDVDALEKEIIRVCEKKVFESLACIRRSNTFRKEDAFEEYIQLYNKIMACEGGEK